MKRSSVRKSSRRPPAPVVALLTDFGLADHFVGAMKGVLRSLHPSLTVIDLSHDVSPQNVRQAGYLLWSAHASFPPGTVFVCVVDPGVGSTRHILAVDAGSYYYLAPDNGLLDVVLSGQAHFRAVLVEAGKVVPKGGPVSSTFHGRDLIAPAAVRLIKGRSLSAVGRPVALPVPSSPFLTDRTSPVKPVVMHIDRFGNIVTNIMVDEDKLKPGSFTVGLAGSGMVSTWVRHYAEAPERRPCLLVGSSGLAEICIHNDHAARLLNIHLNSPLKVFWQ